MNEVWKDIVDLNGSYQISDLGRVKNKKTNYVLKTNINYKGYVKICLCGRNYSIHRLVANAFILNYHNLPQINHIDENKINNTIHNLEWCTAKYNINYGEGIEKKTKTQSKPIVAIDKNGNKQYYPSLAIASKETGIAAPNISKVCNKVYKKGYGLARSAGGCKWQYVQLKEG